jgi:hypothetical protein
VGVFVHVDGSLVRTSEYVRSSVFEEVENDSWEATRESLLHDPAPSFSKHMGHSSFESEEDLENDLEEMIENMDLS